MARYCPICDERICLPSGASQDMLIIGDDPTKDDLVQGHPFASNSNFTTAGKVFRKELNMVGLSLGEFRTMYLWKHEPTDSEECYQNGYDTVLSEAKGKKAILLVGSDVVQLFTGHKVSDVSGLRVDSPILSAPLIVAMYSPALALSRSVGEVRFAIGRWKYWLEKENLI